MFLLLNGCRQHQAPVQEKGNPADVSVQKDVAPSGEGTQDTDALLQAALEGRADEVHLILRTGTEVNAVDEEGHTALMFAAFNGHEAIVRELIDLGAAVDQRDFRGRTALLYAATGPFPETVKLLLDHGADPNQVDSDEHFSPLMHAAAEGHLEVVRVLLGYGADPALKDVDGDDAESFARQAGHLDVADYLTERH